MRRRLRTQSTVMRRDRLERACPRRCDARRCRFHLKEAIEAHESNGGEATTVENNFDVNLSTSQQQDVLNFLRSL